MNPTTMFAPTIAPALERRSRASLGCLFGGAVLALLVPGCGGVRQAASYSGDSETPRRSADDIGEAASLPPDYTELGSVNASCTLTDDRRTIDHEWLSDIDCSEARLRRALDEEAAARGGDILIERECSSLSESVFLARRRTLRCTAGVARKTEPLIGHRPIASPSEPPVSDDWRICVDFWPASKDTKRRTPRPSDLVREVADMPVSHVSIGTVKAHCKRGCSERAVHDGVRVAAASLGATDVVAVRCAPHDSGFECIGTAAQSETDPTTNPRAR